MIAVPIAAEPKVTTKPNSSSPSAVPGEASAKIRCRKPPGLSASSPPTASAASVYADGEVDGEQPEQRHAE